MARATSAGPSLPTGTLTFLFTDIEGSTRLVQDLGTAAWLPVLDRHREIVRSALAGHGGIEVQTEGDSFFAVFERAGDAARAAIDAQQGLAGEPWPSGAEIRVRMGLHTGEGVLDLDGTYVGADVHRAARIGAAGHGGQILLSETTSALVADDLPAGAELRSLGQHRLKDLRPERLCQLQAPGLPADFPAVRALDSRPNNLPTRLTSFVGRERELAEASALLEDSRLVSLTGPGGTGKTRLSLQIAASVADRFPDGVWFVALEPIRDAALVPATIARTLGVSDSASRSALETLADHIGVRRVLLVLDNFEQVAEAAPSIGELLEACPELRILVTTRAPLRVSGEQEYPVPGLPAPPDTSRLSRTEIANLPAELRHPAPATLDEYEAVRLFIARALSVRPDFRVTNDNAPAVAQIAARLHGMPLAIELAAARIKLLSPEQILARLESQLALLTAGSRDLPERQQTLRGAITWSYELLDEPSRRLFARLSVFAGGWDLAAAEAVCGLASELGLDILDGLTELVDQSLVRSESADGEPRFGLFETIREFAAETLAASGDADAIAERHARVFADLAHRAVPHLQGTEQRTWLDHLERDHDNLRKALEWAIARPERELAVGLGFDLWRFWQQRGYLNEARTRLTAMEALGWPLEPPLRARLLEALGGVAYWQADPPEAIRWYEEALAIWRTIGDGREIANALYNLSFAVGMPVGDRPVTPEQAARSSELQEEALAMYRAIGDRVGEANILWGIGSGYYFRNETAESETWFRRSLDLFRAEGQRTMEAWALHMLGTTVLKLGRTDEASGILAHALRHFHDSGDLAGVTLTLDDLSAVAVATGDLPRAARLRGAARQLQASTGTGIARWVEEIFEARSRPSARGVMTVEDLERYGAEGAAMPLDDLVAYALGDEAEVPLDDEADIPLGGPPEVPVGEPPEVPVGEPPEVPVGEPPEADAGQA